MVIQNSKKIKQQAWDMEQIKVKTNCCSRASASISNCGNEKTVKWNLFDTAALKDNFHSLDAWSNS